MKTTLALLGLSLLLSTSALALELRPIYWSMTPSGNGSVGSDGQEGTTVDVQSDLGYNSAEAVPGFEGILGQTHQLDVEYIGIDASAENRVDQPIKFGDITYRVNADVSSDLKGTLIRAAYRYNAKSDNVSGGLAFGAEYVDLSADISAPGFGSDSESLTEVVPIVGAFIEFAPVDWFALRGAVYGGKWKWQETKATYVDSEVTALVNHKPSGLFAGGGYRRMSVNGEDDTVPTKVDLVFSGPELFAGVDF